MSKTNNVNSCWMSRKMHLLIKAFLVVLGMQCAYSSYTHALLITEHMCMLMIILV